MVRTLSFVFQGFLGNELAPKRCLKRRGEKDRQMQRKRNTDTEKENKLWIEKLKEKIRIILSF